MRIRLAAALFVIFGAMASDQVVVATGVVTAAAGIFGAVVGWIQCMSEVGVDQSSPLAK